MDLGLKITLRGRGKTLLFSSRGESALRVGDMLGSHGRQVGPGSPPPGTWEGL
jgi:hypothetical protein